MNEIGIALNFPVELALMDLYAWGVRDAKEDAMTTHDAATTKDAYGLRYEPAKFRDRDLAIRHAATCIKPQRVMLGDDGRFWVVCPADAERLERGGIDYAE